MLEEFKNMLNQHDWYYSMSDDSKIYVTGMTERTEITDMAHKLVSNGLKKEAMDIWYSIVPNSPAGGRYEFPIES